MCALTLNKKYVIPKLGRFCLRLPFRLQLAAGRNQCWYPARKAKKKAEAEKVEALGSTTTQMVPVFCLWPVVTSHSGKS